MFLALLLLLVGGQVATATLLYLQVPHTGYSTTLTTPIGFNLISLDSK